MTAVEDRFSILELMAQYSQHVSDRRYEELGRLYTDDGGLEGPEGRRATGPAEVTAYVSAAQVSWGPFKQLNVNHVIVLDGDHATGSSDYFIVRHDQGEQIGIRAAGRYDDTYRRTADGWRFVTRTVTPL